MGLTDALDKMARDLKDLSVEMTPERMGQLGFKKKMQQGPLMLNEKDAKEYALNAKENIQEAKMTAILKSLEDIIRG